MRVTVAKHRVGLAKHWAYFIASLQLPLAPLCASLICVWSFICWGNVSAGVKALKTLKTSSYLIKIHWHNKNCLPKCKIISKHQMHWCFPKYLIQWLSFKGPSDVPGFVWIYLLLLVLSPTNTSPPFPGLELSLYHFQLSSLFWKMF